MNFIFISPQFPHTYWNFTDRLKRNGINVLAIGDTPYDLLDINLKNSLTEYYKVNNMESYDEMFKAVAFFSFKYGKIDWLESNNEYWLEQDARLRTDFNITTGVKLDEIEKYKSKFLMKEYYKLGSIPAPRCKVVESKSEIEEFINEVGYPIILKPDNGVGASFTYKISNKKELNEVLDKLPNVKYVMEEFIDGDIVSYDVITDKDCNPLFESETKWPPSIADIVNNELDLSYYTSDKVEPALLKAGRSTIKAFNVKSRFVHLEFFKLKKAKKGLGKKGDVVALEVNMRPAGGYTPDMMNYAHSTDVYQIWADMVAFNKNNVKNLGDDHFAVYASRRDKYNYKHTHQEIIDKYGSKLVMNERLPSIWWGAMGNYMYTAKAETEEDALEFINFILEKV